MWLPSSGKAELPGIIREIMGKTDSGEERRIKCLESRVGFGNRSEMFKGYEGYEV